MSDDAREELDQIIDRFDTAMLITVSLEGQPRARPMAILKHKAGGSLYFATRADDEKRTEIVRVPDVAVAMQGDGRYLSLSGRARLEHGTLPGLELPSSVKLWFAGGADDPQFTLIVVDPDYAEFWDRSGMRRLEFLWEAGKALARGEPLSDRAVGGHAKLRAPPREQAGDRTSRKTGRGSSGAGRR